MLIDDTHTHLPNWPTVKYCSSIPPETQAILAVVLELIQTDAYRTTTSLLRGKSTVMVVGPRVGVREAAGPRFGRGVRGNEHRVLKRCLDELTLSHSRLPLLASLTIRQAAKPLRSTRTTPGKDNAKGDLELDLQFLNWVLDESAKLAQEWSPGAKGKRPAGPLASHRPQMMARLEAQKVAVPLAHVLIDRMMNAETAYLRAGMGPTDATEQAEQDWLMLEPESED